MKHDHLQLSSIHKCELLSFTMIHYHSNHYSSFTILYTNRHCLSRLPNYPPWLTYWMATKPLILSTMGHHFWTIIFNCFRPISTHKLQILQQSSLNTILTTIWLINPSFSLTSTHINHELIAKSTTILTTLTTDSSNYQPTFFPTQLVPNQPILTSLFH